MDRASGFDAGEFTGSATEVAAVLRALSNERRLMILCELVRCREANVTALGEGVGLSQSALSQHLARMRQLDLVTFRRQGQMLWYRIADPRVEMLLSMLHELYCPRERNKPEGVTNS